MPLTDYEKRKALKEKTGFDVDKAIANSEPDETPTFAQRRIQPVEEAPATPGRRTSGSGYKIINKAEPTVTE